jgi:two-component system KDP operon response regulator KdpE
MATTDRSPAPRTLSMSRPDGPIVLVVEDDRSQRTMISAAMTSRGYRVVEAESGAAALDQASANEPDVVLLDLGLPDLDGIEVCHQLKLWISSPIIVVTADGSESRVIAALDTGADDYVTKPFSMPELQARVRVALRHRTRLNATVEPSQLDLGDVHIDVAAHTVIVAGQLVDVPPRLFKLLTVMGTNAGKVLTYRKLATQLWGPEHSGDVLAPLRVAVSSLRAKLGTGPLRPTIHNAPHVGYRLTVPDGPRATAG